MKELSRIGIKAMGIWLPSEYEDSAYISEKSNIPEFVVREKMGIKRKCRAVNADDIDPSEMAIRASERALEGIDRKSIDLIIWTGSEYKDYNVWSAGIYVQEKLGLTNAFAFDLAARCSTNVVALKVAKALMQSDPSINRALLCGGHKTGDLVNYRDESSRFLYNLADGGSAILLEKNCPNEILETKVITDGAFSEDVLIPIGGTRRPFSKAGKEDSYHLTCPDITGMRKRLEEKSLNNFVTVIEQAAKSSMPNQPIDYLSLLHMKKSAHDAILGPLELRAEQSIYLENYGHFGAPDQVVSLGLAEKNNLLKKGDHVVLASAGIGYTWSAISLKWEESIFSINSLNDLKY